MRLRSRSRPAGYGWADASSPWRGVSPGARPKRSCPSLPMHARQVAVGCRRPSRTAVSTRAPRCHASTCVRVAALLSRRLPAGRFAGRCRCPRLVVLVVWPALPSVPHQAEPKFV